MLEPRSYFRPRLQRCAAVTQKRPSARAYFGVWAAWTGVASAAGPLLAGAFVEVWSWRAVFLPSAVAGLVALVLLQREATPEPTVGGVRVPLVATIALMISLGAVAYLLTVGFRVALHGVWVVLPVGLSVTGGVVLARNRHRHVILPAELVRARNCLPANAATFALYFGMFGLSFLIVLYVQQVLRYSAMWAAVLLLPMSIMLLFAERLARLTAFTGMRWLIVAGTLSAAAAIGWLGATGHPLPFWPQMIVGIALFGLVQLARNDEAWADIELAGKLLINAEVPKLAGLIAYRRKQVDVARAKFEESRTRNPSDCETTYYLGVILAEQAAWDRTAETLIEAGTCLEGWERGYNDEIARLRTSTQPATRVQRQIAWREQQIAEGRRKMATSWFDVAVAYYQLARKDEARQYAERVADDEQFGERARDLLSRLR